MLRPPNRTDRHGDFMTLVRWVDNDRAGASTLMRSGILDSCRIKKQTQTFACKSIDFGGNNSFLFFGEL